MRWLGDLLYSFKALFLLLFLAIPLSDLQAAKLSSCISAIESLSSQSTRSLETLDRLKVGAFNVYNLYNTTVSKQVHSAEHPQMIAKYIQEKSLDFVVLTEVESQDALLKFNHDYLNSAYEVIIHEGNDARGIQISFLIKKDLPFQYRTDSYKTNTFLDGHENREVPLFTRDFPVLNLWTRQQNPETDPPIIYLAGTHLKSKRPRNGTSSNDIRKLQDEEMVAILKQYEKESHSKSAFIVAGDFNGDVRQDAELAASRSYLLDTLDLNKSPLPESERFTHIFFPGASATPVFGQLDAIKVSKNLKKGVLDAGIYRYSDSLGKPLPIPETKGERDALGFDHYPVYVELDFAQIRKLNPSAYNNQNLVPMPHRQSSPRAPNESQIDDLPAAANE